MYDTKNSLREGMELMRIRMILPLLLLSAVFPLFAQIAVKIEPAYPVYMQYDAIPIRVLLRNYTSHPIAFGNSQKLQGEILFRILTPERRLLNLADSSVRPRLAGIILAPGEARTFTFNLASYYTLQEEGLYTVRALVRHPQLKSAYESNESTFRIRKGHVFWSREFGLPDYTGKKKDQKIESRTYKLLRFSDGRNIYYYLMIDDKRHVYAVRRIGFDIGPNLQPQVEIDALARIHIMVAVTPKVYAHYVYDHNGVLENRTVYMRTSTTPFLVRDAKNARVTINGGRMARKDIDYEELKELPVLEEGKIKTEDVFNTPRNSEED